jgi:hypothetical protein
MHIRHPVNDGIVRLLIGRSEPGKDGSGDEDEEKECEEWAHGVTGVPLVMDGKSVGGHPFWFEKENQTKCAINHQAPPFSNAYR